VTIRTVFRRAPREVAAGAAYLLLLLVVAIVAPAFFAPANLRDLALANAAALIVAVGMTLVIVVGQIDISVASQFAVCSVLAGVLAKAGLPVGALLPAVVLAGAGLGAVNGILVGLVGLPSIIVTLAMMVTWRDGLRWATDGAWVQGLPASFQWFGVGQGAGEALILGAALLVAAAVAWGMRATTAGRAVYAVGANAESARLVGIRPPRVTAGVFVVMGALVGLAAVLNAVRFPSVPSNAGSGLELATIAAVVVGGTVITGGRGRVWGSVLGMALLGTIGTALTFVGVNPFWERAMQGAIILAALAADVVLARLVSDAPRGQHG